ncbi:LysR family transcriptional regulator [Mesorhizobium sp. A556]
MMFSLKPLKYVVAAADCGNVTKAARMLNISQPSISTAISDLEAQLGVQLFVRFHARGIALTPAGESIIGEARLLLKQSQDVFRRAQEWGTELTGEISVGCFETLAARYMPALLKRFLNKHKNVKVNLIEGNQEGVLSLLMSGKTEISVTYQLDLPDNVIAKKLIDLPPKALVSSEHPLANRGTISLKELADEPLILLDLPHSRDYFLDLFRKVQVTPRIAYRCRSQELVRGLVAHGQGYTIYNASPVSDATYDGGRVQMLQLEEALPGSAVVRLHLRDFAMRPAVKAFDAFLQQAFEPSG